MTEQEALARMIAPGQVRPCKPYRGGVIQIRLTRACDKACFNCTQGSQLAGPTDFMTPEQFEQAVLSLRGYWGVYGVFGGNPALSPHFEECCAILCKHVPFEQRGLWCNHAHGKAKAMRQTFDPRVSNINVHLDQEAAAEFRRDWPEANIVGEHQDSRHAPVFVAMRDLVPDEGERWALISGCDVNQLWSAAIILFRGELRAFFCEVAAAMASLHQHEPGYPDTGLDPTWAWQNPPEFRLVGAVPPNLEKPFYKWWELPMGWFKDQVRKHCHECGVPLRGRGELAMAQAGTEQTSATHAGVYRSKRPSRPVEVVTRRIQLGLPVGNVVRYLQNAST